MVFEAGMALDCKLTQVGADGVGAHHVPLADLVLPYLTLVYVWRVGDDDDDEISEGCVDRQHFGRCSCFIAEVVMKIQFG